MVATFNVRSLKRAKIHQLAAGCKSHNIDLVVIQEHRGRVASDIEVRAVEEGGLLARTTATARGVGGIGIYVAERIKDLVSFSKINERLMMATIDANPTITVICAYAPTEDKTDQTKSEFYEALDVAIQAVPKHNLLVVAGDFNARIGSDCRSHSDHHVGQYLYHDETNDNGHRLYQLCNAHDLLVAQSFFPHRRGRIWTWTHTGGSRAQLDHILINRKWANSLENCRAYSSVDIASDHRILCARIKVSLRTWHSIKPPPKINWCALADPSIQEQFDSELKNRLAVTEYQNESSAQSDYDHLEKTVRETGECILGLKRRGPKLPSWVSETTIELLERRDKLLLQTRAVTNPEAKTKMELEWKRLRIEVNVAFAMDEQLFIDGKLKNIQEAAETGNSTLAWKLIRQISGKGQKPPVRVRSSRNSGGSTRKQLLDEWRNYFQVLLNGKPTTVLNPPPPAEQNLDIDDGEITLAEITLAISALNNNKAPGFDDTIVAELLKNAGPTMTNKMHNLCNRVFRGEKPPWQWITSKVVPIPKKGDLSLMMNYRGISLTSVGAKLYNRVMLNRIRPSIEKILRPNQAGFRPGRGTTELIAAIRRIIEGASAKQLPLIITFVDFRKAFDSVSRPMLFAIMRHYGIPERVVEAIARLYYGSKAKVFVNGDLSEEFEVSTGVMQGDVLAPYLFILVVDYVMSRSEENFGFEYTKRLSPRYPGKRIADLDYADDIALLESTIERATEFLRRVSEEALNVGLEINTDKTECMIINPSEVKDFGPGSETVTLGGNALKVVHDFKYLGSKVASTGSDVGHRMSLAWTAFWELKKVWGSEWVSQRLKINIFKAAVISILLYGCETWILNQDHERQLNTFATRCYRKILGIRLSENNRTSNADLYERVQQRPLVATVRMRQLRWLGHALRRDENTPSKEFALWHPRPSHGTAKPGAPKTTWHKYIIKVLEDWWKGLTVEDIEREAQNRESWRKIVAVCFKNYKP